MYCLKKGRLVWPKEILISHTDIIRSHHHPSLHSSHQFHRHYWRWTITQCYARHWWDSTEKAATGMSLAPCRGIKPCLIKGNEWKYSSPNRNWRKYTLPSQRFLSILLGLNQVYRSRWILLRVTGYSCVHRLSAHDLSFPLSEMQNPTITNERYKADEAQVNTQVAYQKNTYRWPSENRKSWGDPFHKLCWVSETSTGVSANALNSICTNICNVRSLRQFSDYTQHCQDHPPSIHFWARSKIGTLYNCYLLHYLTLIQWCQYINNICVHAC